MNNLKRVLSLGLSGVMLAGLLTVGASAADFTDAADIQHDEAVNVLCALKIIDGKPDGSFAPEENVSRAQMAKMIAVAMNGGNEPGANTNTDFTDVAENHWAASYIKYCYDLGIISGRGDGTFDPEANVTGYEATKMVLTAMGFDAEAYKLNGAKWATRTDEVARTMTGQKYYIDSTGTRVNLNEPNMYEELIGIAMNAPATRDTAAQLIWNGLQNRTRTVQPTTTSEGGTDWTYITNSTTLLEQRYGATIVTGTYTGNHLSDDKGEKGEIAVTVSGGSGGSTTTYYFPSEMGIENIGEEVKVIYKEGKEGRTGPDRKDTIYGVFNTGKTEVHNITKSDLQSTDAGKVKFDDTTYNMAVDSSNTLVGVKVWTNFVNTSTAPAPVTTANAGITNDKSVDRIKFICDDTGRIEAAYVVTVTASKVTNATASKISINGVGTIDLDEHDVYADAAKGDVVFYTKYYSGDNTYYTVRKAESAEGELDSYKKTGKTTGNHQNVVLDGTTYKFNGEPATLLDLTDDSVLDMADTTLGDSLRVYLADGKVVAVQALDTAVKNYAMITDVDIGDATDPRMTSRINPARITVLYADGTEETVAVHEDSVYQPATGTAPSITTYPITDAAGAGSKLTHLKIGNVIEYSMSGSKLKVEDVLAQESTPLDDGKKAWDSTNKVVFHGASAGNRKVAATDALMFAFVDSDGKAGATAGDDFYVYNLRDLGDITSTTAKPVYMAADWNSKNQVKVVAAQLPVRPDGASSNKVYGIVNTFVGRATVGDTTYNRYIISVEDEDMVVNYVGSLNEGDVVSFDVTNDDCYATGKINNLTANGTTKIVAIDDYKEDARLLTFFGATKAKAGEVNVYEGYEDGTYAVKKPVSVTTDKDVKIVYVNAKDKTTGTSIGVNKFDDTTGKANAIINIINKNLNEDIVDVIVIETSGDGFDAVGFGDNDGVKATLGGKDADGNNTTVAMSDITSKTNGLYMLDKDTTLGAGIDTTKNPEELLFFKFTNTTNEAFTLTIKDTDDNEVYKETSGSLTPGSHVAYVCWKGTQGLATPGTTAITTALSGVYTYTITGATDGTVLEGSFRI